MKLENALLDFQNGYRGSWQSYLKDARREEEMFTPPAEGEFLEFFTQLPTAAKKLCPLHARSTSSRRAEVGEWVDGYFVPEVIFLFDHSRARGEELRVITPDGDPVQEGNKYFGLFEARDVADLVAEAGRYRWPAHAPFQLIELSAKVAGHWLLEPALGAGLLYTAAMSDSTVSHIQIRRDPATEDGTETSAHKFVSFYPTDNGWMRGEPNGPLPFACGHKLADAAGAVVWAHEGISTPHRLYAEIEKVRRGEPSALLDDHPLRDEILGAVHVGYLGGAGRPWRADWDALGRSRPAKVVIVPDNDDPGRGAVRYVSRRLAGMRCTWLQFTSEFEDRSDMSDPWPKRMYIVNEDGAQVYRADAPRCEDLEHPASWLTRQLPAPPREPGQRGRPPAPKYALIDGVTSNWVFVEEMGKFYSLDRPWRAGLEATILNRILSRFSDVDDVARLISKTATRAVAALTYRPDMPPGLVTEDNLVKLNQYVPPAFAPAASASAEDLRPFIEFMEHLIPDPAERHELKRWTATFYARPDRRMHYGNLLQSRTQGSGKTTYGEILARLAGSRNVAFPSESEVVDNQFNGWKKGRLAVVNEIYGGHGWTAYNKLKDAVTDHKVRINEKNEKQYERRAFAHFLGCSNEPLSLRIAHGDRRWFIPRVREEKFGDILNGDMRAVEFYKWLDGPGIPLIARWAFNFEASEEGKYVETGAHAPDTERKQEQVEDSYSDLEKFAIDVFERMAASPEPKVISEKRVREAAELIWKDLKVKPGTIERAASSVRGIVVRAGRLKHDDTSKTASIRNEAYGAETGWKPEHKFDLSPMIAEYQAEKNM